MLSRLTDGAGTAAFGGGGMAPADSGAELGCAGTLAFDGAGTLIFDGAGAPAILALAGPGAGAGTKLSKGVLVFVPDVEFAPSVEFVVAFDGGANVVLPGRGEESATLVFVASGANSGDACTPHASY